MEQERFGFPLGFAPRGHPRRTPGRERSIGHWTGSRPRQATTSNRRDHSLRATSRRTTAFSYLELVGKYPRAAGAALYTHKAFGINFLTFMVTFTVMASGVTSCHRGEGVR